MRELFVVTHESNSTSLVLRARPEATEGGDTGAEEEFFLDLSALDDDVRALFAAPQANGETSEDSADAGETGPSAADTSAAAAPAPATARGGLQAVGSQPARPRSENLTMRPPEIQQRIRAGASIAELAEEMSVTESRVEPFAHPVLLERARIAELAKQAHPVREDGPAKLPLYEVLATAFAARGHSLSEASWDAYRIKGEPWTIRLTWKAGLSENEALWLLRQSLGSPDTLEARNTVAADLTDPDFVQPVRSLTSVGRGSRRVEAIDDRTGRGEPAVLSHLSSAYPEAADDAGADDGVADERESADTAEAAHGAADNQAEEGRDAAHAEEGQEEEFFRNPAPQPAPKKRRRKAVTPHWEDVLLGVRANTKRPRD